MLYEVSSGYASFWLGHLSSEYLRLFQVRSSYFR